MRNIGLLITFFSVMGFCWTACEKPAEKVCSSGSFIDERDGEVYCKTTIGAQTWMAENLRYKSDSSTQNPLNPMDININYGRLYNFNEAQQSCPNGWHLPTDAEWKTLELFLGVHPTNLDDINERGTGQGDQLKSKKGWQANLDTAVVGTNDYGFNALPSGERNPSFGPYYNLGTHASFWTATEFDTTGGAWMRDLSYENEKIGRLYFSQKMGYACRCVKD